MAVGVFCGSIAPGDGKWGSPWRALLLVLREGSCAQASPSRCAHTVPEMAWGEHHQQSQNRKQGFRHTGATRVKDTHAIVRGRETRWPEVDPTGFGVAGR